MKSFFNDIFINSYSFSSDMTKEWEKVIKSEFRKYGREMEQRTVFQQLRFSRRYISIPIILGVWASIFIYFRFGGEELLRTLLSWVVGVTIVATVIAAVTKSPKW